MNDDQLNRLFNDNPVPNSDPVVKQAIKAAAVAAFKGQGTEVFSEQEKNVIALQGNESSARPNGTSDINGERTNTMNETQKNTKKWLWLSGVAASTVFCFGLLSLRDTLENEIADSPSRLDESVMADSFSAEKRSLGSSKVSELARPVEAERLMEQQTSTLQEVQSQYAEEVVVTGFRAKLEKHALQRSAAPLNQGLLAEGIGRLSDAEGSAFVSGSEGDRFKRFKTSNVKQVEEQPVSTFSIDVDTASYSYVRRQLNQGRFPQVDAVRIEELINYFDYQYPLPDNQSVPFATSVSVMDSPWKKGNKLLHIGIKGYELSRSQQLDSNVVFLLDVSGSMNAPDKLPLVKQSMSLLLATLKPSDTVAIVVYAGAAGAVLEPTLVKEKAKILSALHSLESGGSTAGAQGVELAYQLAELNFKKDAVNRIILATDGDFNVGVTADERLEDFVARKREKGIYLSVLGFGSGNYQDARMQSLAQSGNGIAAYIDTLSEAQKVLAEEASSSLFPIANDVKIQVEFNPKRVAEYRLVGYETRTLRKEDFNNDKIDAGDIGAGHTVTAIYDITPVGSPDQWLDKSRYQADKQEKDAHSSEYGFLKLRYKLPGGKKSQLIASAVLTKAQVPPALQAEVDFSVAVATFGQLLRGGDYLNDWNYDKVIDLAQKNKGSDPFGYRTEFIQLVRKAKIAEGM